MARKMTLRERAKYFAGCQDWASHYQINPATGERFRTGPTMDEGVILGWLAGWRARGRADRVTKAVVDAAKIYCGSERGKLEAAARDGKSHWARLLGAVAKLERAKGRK